MDDPTTEGDGHRPIIVKFLRWKDKEAVMASANKLRGTNIYLNENYSEAVRLKQKELIPIMKAERAKGNIAYIRYDRPGTCGQGSQVRQSLTCHHDN